MIRAYLQDSQTSYWQFQVAVAFDLLGLVVAETSAAYGCDPPISFDSCVFRYRTPREHGICFNFPNAVIIIINILKYTVHKWKVRRQDHFIHRR